jgi:hypothetical protein
MPADIFFQVLEDASVKTIPPEPRVINIIEGEDWRALIMAYLCHYYEPDSKNGPAFRTSRSDAIVDAAWQAITSWVLSNESRLQNSVHYLLPYQKKDQLKAYGVKKDIPRMEMVHHQDVAVELSTRLLTAQHEIETLRTQL